MRKGIVPAAVVLMAVAVFVLVARLTNTGYGVSTNQSTPTSVPAVLHPPDVSAGWKLDFDSNFSGGKLDDLVWGSCYPWASGDGCTNFGNNNENEWYLPSQVQVSGDTLQLVAQRIPTTGYDRSGASKEYLCRSGMVTTYPSFHFQYGYLQVIARIPSGTQLWPALWLAAADLRWPPEIDLLEHWGASNTYLVTLHSSDGGQQGTTVNTPDILTGWHTFGLYWTRTSLIWYFDGQEVFSTAKGIPKQPMYFIASLASIVPSSSHTQAPPPSGCSGSLIVRSVRVWEPTK